MYRPILICLLALLSCTKDPDPVGTLPDPPQENQDENGDNKGNNDTSMPDQIKITVSGKSLPVKIEDNEATKALSKRSGPWGARFLPAIPRLPPSPAT